MSILEYFKMSNDELEQSDYKPVDKTINVYTDGSCIHNGKPNAKAGIGVFFGESDPRNVSERIEGKQSNNTAELKAIIRAIHLLDTDISLGNKIIIYSDSDYSIKCATTYGRKMQNLMHSNILLESTIRFWWRDDDVIDATEETDSETP